MNWYTASILDYDVDLHKPMLGTAIVPFDALRDEKVIVSEKLHYEVRDYIPKGWTIHPSFIKVSEFSESNSSSIGKEIVLNASSIHMDDDIIIIRFDTDDYDIGDQAMDIVVASGNNNYVKENKIFKWSNIKNFSLYCFLVDVTSDFSILLY